MKQFVVAALALAVLLSACEREARRFESSSPTSKSVTVTMSGLQPGQSNPSRGYDPHYQENAFAISQGKRLFSWFNCVGCHAHGGGAIGPALMDSEWVYGSEPANIYATILEGRPNGMPSFRGRITDEQLWQLVAYVRSMSGLVPSDAAPGRSDTMQTGTPEGRRDNENPRMSSTPPSSQR
jgi:cytochrome c oxidase cbb3-type subunit 3